MRQSTLLSAVLLSFSQILVAQQPARNSEAAKFGLLGAVHTVLTESLDYRDSTQGTPADSTLASYDAKGYLLEEYRYYPDGKVHLHTIYTRKDWQIFKQETTSAIASESRTIVQTFNSVGDVTLAETIDGGGSAISKTKTDFPSRNDGPTVSSTQVTNANGGVTTVENVGEKTDPRTGLSQHTETKDGKPSITSLVERDSGGKPVIFVSRFADGSFNEREVRPDGRTVEHKYDVSTKTHAYQTIDAHNRVLEAIDDAPGVYIRTTFQYDDLGRDTETANYDRSGKLLHKIFMEYQEDENGNWIEQKEFDWDDTLGDKPPKLVVVSRRTITYY